VSFAAGHMLISSRAYSSMVERKTDNLEAIGSSPIVPNLAPNKMTEYVGVLLYIRFATGLGIIILFAAAKVAPRRLD
jgi:hypothetical protein